MPQSRAAAAFLAVMAGTLVSQLGCRAEDAYACDGKCSSVYKKDGYCDDANNNCGCNWDGGDCCESKVVYWSKFCVDCECLDPRWHTTTSGPRNCTSPPCVVPSPLAPVPSPLANSPSPSNETADEAPSGSPAPRFNQVELGLPAPDPDDEDVFSSDNITLLGSCVGRCGNSSGDCWCNGACFRFNDCCEDYEDECEHTTTTTHEGLPAPGDLDEDLSDALPAPDFTSTSSTAGTTTTHVFDGPAPKYPKKRHWPRSPGPTTTTTLGPWDFSCEDKCRLTLEKGTRGGCYCDQDCVEYDDCCLDWESYCLDFVFPAPDSRDIGCMDTDACNFSPGAEEEGECIYLSDVVDSLQATSDEVVDCDGCLVEVDCAGACGGSDVADECGICGGDGLACARCSDSAACNFDANHSQAALVNDDACTYPEDNYDCFGACNVGFDCVGVCGGSTVDDECGVCGGNSTCCVSRGNDEEAVARRQLNLQDWEDPVKQGERKNPAPGVTNPAPNVTVNPWVAPSPDATTEAANGVTDQPPNDVPAPDDSGAHVLPAPQSSCEGNCEYLAQLKNAACFCDDSCVVYEDCCDDKEQYCPFHHGQPVPSPGDENDFPAPSVNISIRTPVPSPVNATEHLPAPDTSTTTSSFNFTTGPAPAPLLFFEKGTCAGFCLSLYGSHGKLCYCDKTCKDYDDCCSDFGKACKGVTTTTTTTTTTVAPDSCEDTDCNGTSWDGSCFCDELCRLNDDCCDDRDVYCDHGHCFNQVQDEDEDDVDCGGSCDLSCDNCLACEFDCEGKCFSRSGVGTLVDACGVCGGNGSLCAGCMARAACNYNENAGLHDPSTCLFASDVMDCAGNCLADHDCAGNCDGSVVLDECGVCGGDNSTCTGCSTDESACNYLPSDFVSIEVCIFPRDDHHDCFGKCTSDYDCCHVCGGNGSSCNCTTTTSGTSSTHYVTRASTIAPANETADERNDTCIGYCGGRTASGCYCDDHCQKTGDCCEDMYRVCVLVTNATTAAPTTTFVCDDGYDCEDVCNGTADVDTCGVCNGYGASCAAQLDCFGKFGGDAVLDECGVCNGFGASCNENYCSHGDLDCFGKCNGTGVLDDCDVCGGDSSACCDGDVDCSGECGGSLEVDSCGVCGGFGAACAAAFCSNGTVDCAGECGGNSTYDACDVCGGNGTACLSGFCDGGSVDCAGTCNGTAVPDECDVCGGNGAACAELPFCSGGLVDCAGDCNGGILADECGVCGGDGTSCCDGTVDCAKMCGGSAVIDECNVCNGFGASCTTDFCMGDGEEVDCLGECDGGRVVDECDVCGGDGTSCIYCYGGTVDCAGECEGSHADDSCGICGGDGTSCLDGACDGGVVDCNGECNGIGAEDECGVCGGNGASCAEGGFCSGGVVDCEGVCDGSAKLDACNTCNGDGSTCKSYASCASVKDCDGTAPSGCYCDDTCQAYGDCCKDIREYCVFRPPPSPAPASVDSNVLDLMWQFSGSTAFALPASESSAALASDDTDVPSWEAGISFVVLPQPSTFKEVLSLSGQMEASISNLAAPETADDTVRLALRTPTVYADNSWCNVLVWTAGFGSADADVSVMLVLDDDQVNLNETFDCGTVESGAGVECQFELGAEWFASTANEVRVQAFVSGTEVASEAHTLATAPLPADWEEPGDATVLLQLPAYPALAGGQFETPLFASTVDADVGDFALATWVVSLTLLSTSGTEDSSLSNCATVAAVESDLYKVSYGTAGNVITLVGIVKAAITNSTLLMSSTYTDGKLDLAHIKWKLDKNATKAGFATVFVDDLVSSAGSLKIVDDETGLLVVDGAASTSAQTITVEPEATVALQAEVDEDDAQEFVNLAVLGSTVANKTVNVFGITSCHSLGSDGECQETSSRKALSNGNAALSCTSKTSNALDAKTLSASTCVVGVDGNEAAGGDVSVEIAFEDPDENTFSTSVRFRVWCPVDITVDVVDVDLNEVMTDGGGFLDPPIFQSTKVGLSAKLSVGTEFTTPRVDLSKFVDLVSSAEDVALVAGRALHGLTPGKATVSCDTCVASASTVNVVVSDASYVTVMLDPIVVTDVAVEVGDFVDRNAERLDANMTAIKPFFSVDSTAVLQQKFTAEGDSGFLFAYLRYSDGNSFLLDNNTHLGLEVTAGAVNLSVVNDSVPFFELVVPVGGGSQKGLFGVLSYVGDGDALVAKADVNLTVEKPDIDYVKLELSEDVIYPALDTMAKYPFKLPTSTELTATVYFLDGSAQDYSKDSRAVYSSSSAVVKETDDHGTFEVAVTKIDNALPEEALTLSVTVGGKTATVKLAVDIALSLEVIPVSSPACTLDGCTDKLLYYKFEGDSPEYERFRLTAVIGTALGYDYDLPLEAANVKFSLNDLQIFGGTCADRRVLADASNSSKPAPSPFEQACEGAAATDCCDTEGDVETNDVGIRSTFTGSTNIVVSFREFSLSTTVQGKTATVKPAQLSVVKPTGTVSANITASVYVTFSDDTGYNTNDAFYGISNFLLFESSDEDVLIVDEDGVLAPIANSVDEEYVDFTVTNLAGTISDSKSVLVNVDPAFGDVDTGEAAGFQFGSFGDAAVGDTVDVPVRFNSGQVPLTGFQIQLFFDNTVLKAVGVVNGDDWTPSVTSTLGSPSTMVQVLSSAPASTVKGPALELAVVTFEVVGSGATSVTGTVVETLTTNGVHIGDDDRPVMAGAGVVNIGTDRRSLRSALLSAPYAAPTWPAAQPRRRSLLDCEVDNDVDCLRGDINADCAFTLSDLDFLIRYMTGADVEFDDETYQMAMMDADLDDDVDAVDIAFVLNALAKKYVFLHSLPTVTIDECSVNVSVSFCDDTSKLVRNGTYFSILVELGSDDTDNFGLGEVTAGTFESVTDDGFLVEAERPDATANASFFVTSTLNATVSTFDLGVVLLVETLADTGVEDELRKFSWRGSSFGFYGESGFAFDPIVTVEFGCTCDSSCSNDGFFKTGCNSDGSDGDSTACVACSSNDVGVYPISNGGVSDSCAFDPCPVGHACNYSATSLMPVECAPGTYQDDEGATACKECEDGSYQPVAGKSQCVACADDCGDGNYTAGCNGTSAGSCAPCTPHVGYTFVGSGHWNDTCTLEEVAADCPIGQFKHTDDFFQYSCQECDDAPDGFYYSDQGGFYPVCPTEACFVGCDVGFFNSGCGGSSEGACEACSVPANGTYFSGDGNLEDACETRPCAVESCAIGHYLNGCSGTSAGECNECTEPDDGYFVSRGGTEDNCETSDCEPCPTGEYLSGCGGTSAGTCTACTRDSGFYIVSSDSLLAEDVCDMLECATDCDVGFFNEGCDGTNNGTCVPCSDAPSGFVIVSNGGLEDACEVESCSADCPVGEYNDDCGNITNPEGTCVACSAAPPGFFFTGDGNLSDTCTIAACDVDACDNSEYLAGCEGTNAGACTRCTSSVAGSYWTASGGLRDACTQAECASDCPDGQYRGGCDGETTEGECVACTNAPAGAIYTSDGGLANACTYIECESTCGTGEYLASCTEDDNECEACTNNGSTVCMTNGAEQGRQFAYAPSSVPEEIARLACESENGAGSCEKGTCGGFRYFYNFADGHCDCNKANGTVEWIYENEFGLTHSSQDYGDFASGAGDINGDSLFTRGRIKMSCDDASPSWELLELNLGVPSAAELSAASQDCGGFYYTGDGDVSDDCPTALCNVDCPYHQYNSGCGGTSAGACTNCSAIPAGFYFSQDGDLADDCKVAECVDECPHGFYLSGCYSGPGECVSCTAPANKSYLSSNGNMEDACNSSLCITSCPEGQYMKGTCGGEDGNQDYECTDCLDCGLGFAVETSCNGTTYTDVTVCVAPVFARTSLGNNNTFDTRNGSFILFGENNTAKGDDLFTGNGNGNLVESAVDPSGGLGGASVIIGGQYNDVFGGSSAEVGGTGNCVGADTSTVLGGDHNDLACDERSDVYDSIIAAGLEQLCQARRSVVSAGYRNKITQNGDYTVVAGGQKNSAANDWANIIGGRSCKCVSNYALALGGYAAKANGRFSSILGGARNTANGKFAVAFGFQARAASPRSMVLGFDKSKFCRSIGENSVNVCAKTGFYINGDDLAALVKAANSGRRRSLEEFEGQVAGLKQTIDAQWEQLSQKRALAATLRRRLTQLKQRAHTGRRRAAAGTA